METALKFLLAHDHVESTEHNCGNNYDHTRSYRPHWKSPTFTEGDDEDAAEGGYEASEDPTLSSDRSHRSVRADHTDNGSPIPPIGDFLPIHYES